MRYDVPPGPPPTSPPKDQTPEDRATTFQAVEGKEQFSGSTLVVEAYAAIWLLLLGFVFLQWRKQATLHARLDELEKVVDRAAQKLEDASLKGKKAPRDADADVPADVDAQPKEA